jgi:hypothetical protein
MSTIVNEKIKRVIVCFKCKEILKKNAAPKKIAEPVQAKGRDTKVQDTKVQDTKVQDTPRPLVAELKEKTG